MSRAAVALVAPSTIPNHDGTPPTSGGNYIMQGRYHAKALDAYHLILAPTHACNLRCKHCYLPDHVGDLLPKAVALRLVDEWAEITLTEKGPFRGIFHVKGGEPFVVRYLSDIVDRLVELRCLRFMMTTNGTHSKPKDLELLARAQSGLDGHLTVVVSLDGASAETHDFLRGAGQFERTCYFLEYLRKIGIETFLNCVLHQGNIGEIRDFLTLAKDYSVAQVNFLPLVPKGFGKSLRCHQVPHVEVHRALSELYASADDETRALLAGSLPDIVAKEKKGEFIAAHECVAGYRGLFYIKPDGSAFTCPNLEDPKFSLGNVKEMSLSDLHDRLGQFRSKLRMDGHDDTYLCTGERMRYEDDEDHKNLKSLNNLKDEMLRQDNRSSNIKSLSERSQVAFCVSRNW